MSGSQQLLLAEGGGGFSGPFVYIEQVFSTFLYTGNAVDLRPIVNGLDISGKGGLVWTKSRSSSSFPTQVLNDTVRGAGNYLNSASTNGQATPGNIFQSFNSDGFTIRDSGRINATGVTYTSWSFCEQPKFFDIVPVNNSTTTYNHNLGSTPGCIIVKCTNSSGANWVVWHRTFSNTVTNYLSLNTSDPVQTQAGAWPIAPTATQFSVNPGLWADGTTGIAYLFAHDAGGFGLTGLENVVSCGKYTGTDAGQDINLGYEAQWVMIKRLTGGNGEWAMFDVMRGMAVGGNDSWLYANTADDEQSGADQVNPTATGFRVTSTGSRLNEGGSEYIYIAIRRGPMAVPTTGSSVFAVSQAVEPQSSALVAAGFSDMVIHSPRVSQTGNGHLVTDRLRGAGLILLTQNENAENDQSGFPYTKFDSNAGAYIPAGGYYNNSGGGSSPYVMSAFRRAPQFFDEVCYTGNSANRTLSHNLGIAPELMIVKKRSSSSTSNWVVYPGPLANNDYYLFVNSDQPVTTASVLWNSTAPTSTVFTLGASINANDSGQTYVNYLFATCAGVSKVGSYTGTGTTQTINCGFTSGARWVMIKRTDSTGDWYYWNSASGIVAGNDPYLTLNTTNAQVTNTDYVDTASSGFEISSTAPAEINANGGTYIFLAIA